MQRFIDRDRRRRWVTAVSQVLPVLAKLGITTGRAQVLTTTGRRSGQPRTAMVGVVPIGGQRYIFQAYPRSAWVANVRADPHATLTRGRRSSAVLLIEVPVGPRRGLLLRQLRNDPGTGRLLVASGLVTGPAPETVAAAADRIAVFRVERQRR
ncbi:nitroreductase/quinone reductase family protein [Amycolatopsis sp. PS_44_ISF1]|uniref:nitroreductase/quinone reductase family protein n=1 Tax=Amycolatopsis sp. PS_44_ISF1 TaxID=2974917 RepID=UPI0028DEC255|nr:nitroreductase/quinone reductase family protein [Amycolatopsis sp. PS_44_ISF1]MDT8911988.1 nitroreductase/quinone reductase family protein [Amycolatopsis sp. PS_44_ISF1]